MSEILEQVDEIAKTIPEVAPPGWGHTVAKKEKTKPNKPKSKVGGSAHEFQKDLDSGKFKGLPGDKTKADKKASMFKLMWSMKNKGDKPHYKPGVKDKLKSQYKEEVEESNLPPHLSKFLDKDGNPNKAAQARIDAGRKKRAAAAAKPKITDVTPKGYGPKEEVEMDEWGDTSILSKQSARIAGRPDIGSMDNKPHRKLKITQQGLDALRKDRDRPKVKTQVKITKKGRDALKKEEIEEPNYEKRAKKNISAADRKRAQDKRNKEYFATQKKPSVTRKKKAEDERNKEYFSKARLAQARGIKREGRFASAASDPRMGGSSSVDTVPDFALKAKKGAMSAPGSGSIAKAKKAKASDVNKSIEQQMKDAMKESSDKWRKNFKANAEKRRGETARRREAEKVGQKAEPRQKDMGEIPEEHNCNEVHPDKTHSKWLKTQNEDWKSIKEAQWKIKLKGLPTFYVPGKSAGEVRQMLRRQLKRPMDDIEDITRATPAAQKKDFRDRAQGKEAAVVSGKS